MSRRLGQPAPAARSFAAMPSLDLDLKLRYLGWPLLRWWALLHIGLAGVGALLAWQWPAIELPDASVLLPVALVLVILFVRSVLNRPPEPASKPAAKSIDWEIVPVLLVCLTFCSAVCTVPAYVLAQLGRRQHLPTLAALPQYPPARYYQASTTLLDTLHRVAAPTTFLIDKNTYRRFQLVIACPAVSQLPAPTAGVAPVWVAYDYQADTRAQEGPVDAYWPSYQRFLAQHQAQFRREFERPCYYFERQAGGQLADAFYRALPAADSLVLVRPVYTPFAARASGLVPYWLWPQGIGNGLLLLCLLVMPLDPLYRQRLLAAKAAASSFSV